MTDLDIQIAEIINASTTSMVDISKISSLKELYENRRDSLHLTDRQVLKILGMDANSLKPILNGTAKQINLISMVKLGHFLGLTVNDMIKVYVPEFSPEQIGEIQRAREAGYIMENFDIATLQKEKFIEKNISGHELATRICRFFGLSSIFEYNASLFGFALSKTAIGKDTKIRDFWLKSAFYQFKEIENPHPYSRQALLGIIPRIKPYSRNEEHGLKTVIKALYRIGVTLIYQPSMAQLQVRGATMVVYGKPCIVLSDWNKSYPNLWFALMHEVYHVLYDLKEIEEQSYHISNDGEDLFLMNEDRANDFARKYFIDESRMHFLRPYMSSPYHVEQYAKEWGVHPSLIYAIHCYVTNEWGLYKPRIPNSDKALKYLNTHPFSIKNIRYSIKNRVRYTTVNIPGFIKT